MKVRGLRQGRFLVFAVVTVAAKRAVTAMKAGRLPQAACAVVRSLMSEDSVVAFR
jgi:hypothetical protein